MEVEWAGTSQVARRCIRVGVWEVHGGCARKGGGSDQLAHMCRVSLDWMPSVSCVIYNQNGKKFRFKANPNLRDVVKNQNQRMTPKINMDINHVHK